MKLDLKTFVVWSLVGMSVMVLLMTYAAGWRTGDFAVFYEMAKQIIVSGLVGAVIANILVGSHRAPAEPPREDA